MPFDGLWGSSRSNYTREVKQMLELRLGSFTTDADTKLHEKIFNQLAKYLKKHNNHQNELERFLEVLADRQGRTDCFKVPRDIFKKIKLGDDRSNQQIRSAPAFFFAKVFAYASLSDPSSVQPRQGCFNQYDPNGTSVCIHPHHTSVKVESFLINSPVDSTLDLNQGLDIGISPAEIQDVLSESSTNPGSPGVNNEFYGQHLNMIQNSSPNSTRPTSFNMGPSWISISYYEYEKSFGNRFTVHGADRIIVDGYTAPESQGQQDTPRFSLGIIGNINRQRDAELARGCIGEGISIHTEYGRDGNINYFLTNVSNSSVFVQSPACNLENKWHYATVVRVPNNCQLKIFSDDSFHRILQSESSQARQGSVSVFDRTFNLSRLTAIRASFVKGWGQGYRRSTIMECPCWIELHLSKPQKILDSVLSEFTPGPGNSQT